MPYPQSHRAETKARIVLSARILFNQFGFNSVSIGRVMLAAGLTHGVFYKYFDSKSDLYIAVLRTAYDDAARFDVLEGGPSPDGLGGQIVRAYLSTAHLQQEDAMCPMCVLPSDVARSDDATRLAFNEVFGCMVDVMQRSVANGARASRTTALAVATMCIGGMVIARASHGRALGDELRAAAIEVALELGGWSAEPNDIDAREIAAAAG